jgi:hypothetical protein
MFSLRAPDANTNGVNGNGGGIMPSRAIAAAPFFFTFALTAFSRLSGT